MHASDGGQTHRARMDDQRPAGKRRLRFSILNLLLLTAIVALTVSWWLDHRRLVTKTVLFEHYKNLSYQEDKQIRDMTWSAERASKRIYRAENALAKMRNYDPRFVDVVMNSQLNVDEPLPEITGPRITGFVLVPDP